MSRSLTSPFLFIMYHGLLENTTWKTVQSALNENVEYKEKEQYAQNEVDIAEYVVL